MKRPGGRLASRPLHFFWMVDCSGSMEGDKIGTLNHTIQTCIPEMRKAARNNPNVDLYVRTLRFATGAQWMTKDPVHIDDFVWNDLEAYGFTELGEAYELLREQLKIPPMPRRALPPVIVLVSDGQPTDTTVNQNLGYLKKTKWFQKAVKIAIAIGRDVDEKILAEFTGNPEYVLYAGNASDLVKLIRWASTAASMVSAPSIPTEEGENADVSVILDLSRFPEFDDVSVEDVW